MKQDARKQAEMERIRRQIADRLRAGESLSSRVVLALSRRLDRLVLACYREG